MAIGDPYQDRASFKAILDISSSDEDSWIDTCLRASSRAIERRSGWPTFWRTSGVETRNIDTRGKLVPIRTAGYQYSKLLLRTGIASSTGLVVGGASAPVLLPEDAASEGRPFDSILLPYGVSVSAEGTISITAVWGWPEVPADIVWAAQMQAHRLYRRKGSPEGIAGSAEWGLTRVPALDPDVLSILKGGGFMRAGIG